MPKKRSGRPSQKDRFNARRSSTAMDGIVSGQLDGGTPLVLDGSTVTMETLPQNNTLLGSALEIASGVSSEAAQMIKDVESHLSSPNVQINARVKKSSTVSTKTTKMHRNITTGETNTFEASSIQHQEMQQSWSSGRSRNYVENQSVLNLNKERRIESEQESPSSIINIPIGVVESPLSPERHPDCQTFPYSAQQSTDSNNQDQGLESVQVVRIDDDDSEANNTTVKVSAVKRGAENVLIGPAKLTITQDKRDGRPRKLSITPIVITEATDIVDEENIVKTPTIKQRRKSMDNTVQKVLESGQFGGFNINNLVHEVHQTSTKESVYQKIANEARKKSAAFLSPDDIEELSFNQQKDEEDALEVKDDLSKDEYEKILNEYKSELGMEDIQAEEKVETKESTNKISHASIHLKSEMTRSAETTSFTKSGSSSQFFKSGMKTADKIVKESKQVEPSPLRIVELKKADDIFQFTRAVINKASKSSSSSSNSSSSESINIAFTENTSDSDNDDISSMTVHAVEMFEGKAVLKIVRAKDLENKDIIGKSDPFVLVKYGDQEYKTETIKNTLNPTWDKEYAIDVHKSDTYIQFCVFDWDRYGDDDSLGTITINIPDLVQKTSNGPKWLDLQNCKTGSILVSLRMVDHKNSEKHVTYEDVTDEIKDDISIKSSEKDDIFSVSTKSRLQYNAYDSMIVEPGSPASYRVSESRMSISTIPDVFKEKSLLNNLHDFEHIANFLSGFEAYSHPVTINNIQNTTMEISHYLDLKNMSSGDKNTIRVVIIIDNYTSETCDVMEVRKSTIVFECPEIQQWREITIVVVSELKNLSVHAQIFPLISTTLAIGLSLGNPKYLSRYLNKRLRKCGYEKQVTVQKGVPVLVNSNISGSSTSWTIPFTSYQEFSFSENSDYIIPTKDFMDISIIQEEKVVFSTTVSFYNLERVKREIGSYRAKPESWALMPFHDKYPDMNVEGWSSNLEPLYNLARSARLSSTQFKALLKQLDIETKDIDESSMVTHLKSAITTWKAEKGVLANLEHLATILQQAEVALSSVAKEILQNVANTKLGIHFFG